MNKTGFGFLRLPRLVPEDETSLDMELICGMVDRFLERGGRYFDTAYTYLGGASEVGLRKALVERHPRDAYILADKLPTWKVSSREECWLRFREQQERCGVEKFDVYLLHWLNEEIYGICESYDGFGFLEEVKAKGLADRIGFSFHDSPRLLDRILTEHPGVDYVQLQINYLDWDSPALQARELYETAVKHGKKVIVMEPVRGGHLASLPEAGEALLRGIRPEESMASWAIRFAQNLPEVEVVLSGMSATEQVDDNLRDLPPLEEREREALKKVAEMIRSDTAVPCTGCNYCAPNCPQNIPIPKYFALYNDYARTPAFGWKMGHAYNALAAQYAKASDCLTCGACERNCPQKLDITGFLKKTAEAFEKN